MLTNAIFEAASESCLSTSPPHCPPTAEGPTPSELPPIESSWNEVNVTLLPGVPSTCRLAPPRETSGEALPTSMMAALSLKIAPSSIITVTFAGTLKVCPSASGRPAESVPTRYGVPAAASANL